MSRQRLVDVAKPWASGNLVPPGVTVTEMVSVPVYGAALVQFETSTYTTTEEVITATRDHMEAVLPQSKFSLQPECHTVLGKPFAHDISNMHPTSLVKLHIMEPSGAEPTFAVPTDGLSLEQFAFSLMRPYGRIVSMDFGDFFTKPATGTGTVQVRFQRRSHAVAAVLALNGTVVQGGRVLSLEPVCLFAWQRVKAFAANNKRGIVLVSVGAFVAALLAIVGAVRLFFVKAEITDRFGWRSAMANRLRLWQRSLSEYSQDQNFGSTLTNVASAIEPSKSAPAPLLNAFTAEEADSLQRFVSSVSRTPLVVYGPTGTGKSRLVASAVKNRNMLDVDVRPLLSRKQAGDRVQALATQVGFWPGFNMLRLLSRFVEAVAPGVAAGLSTPTEEGDMVTVLEVVHQALKEIQTDASEAGEASKGDGLPVVVFRGFRDDNAHLPQYKDLLALFGSWASRVTHDGLAQVLFVTDNPLMVEDLTRDSAVDSVELHDVGLSVATEYVRQAASPGARRQLFLESGELTEEAKAAVLVLGRVTALESWLRKVNAGVSPTAAAASIVKRAEVRLRTALLDPQRAVGEKPLWTTEQLWRMVEAIAKHGSLPYSAALFDVLDGNEEALRQLTRLQLLRTGFENGAPATISASSNVMRQACSDLVADGTFAAGVEFQLAKQNRSKADTYATTLQAELLNLATLRDGPTVTTRRRQLEVELGVQAAKWDACTKRMASAKAALKSANP